MSITSKNHTLNYDESYCQFGCNTLSTLLKNFETQIDGVIENKDIEYVHKMRVNSRKIRTVLLLFQSCYPKKKYKRWLKEIKAITKLLREARDLDVQITFIQKYIQESPTERHYLTPLLKDHRDQRNVLQKTVTEGLEKLQHTGVLKELSDFLKQINYESSRDSFDSLSVIEKASQNITSRLKTFLALSKYVHQESASLKHHEMRIDAKHLRYTMETFAPLYKNELTQEIQLMKNFQDLLGEIHDCDIWLITISHFTTNQPENDNQQKPLKKDLQTDEFKKAATAFLAYITEHRKRNYNNFIQQWDKAMKQNFFDNLKKTVNTETNLEEKQFDSNLLLKNNIKIAVLADIHANIHALEIVIQDAEKRGAQLFLNAGDSIGYGAFPNEVLHLIYEKNMLNVCGNFDAETLKNSHKHNSNNSNTKKVALSYTKKELTKSCKIYLNSFAAQIELELANKKVFMTHASPLSPTEHLTPDTPERHLKKVVAHTDADIIIVGHSHEQFHKQLDDVSIINPGSVGRPGDGNPQAAYVMLSLNPLKIDLIRLKYPVEAAAEALRKKGLPESFAQMLLNGMPLNTIVSKDKTKKQDPHRNWPEIIKTAQDLTETCLQDKAHLKQVQIIALDLFDNLQSLHHLDNYERNLLECAALLHDLGLSQGIKGHNKTSMTLILNESSLPLTSEERRIIASIARYHRKGLPKQNHYNLTSLNSKTINIICALSGILRIADAFDYLHNADFKLLAIKIVPKKIVFECFSTSNTSLIEQAFNKKKNLFEIFFKKKAMLIWNKQ
ncbi:MAG: YfcE family phosphodiesterase [Candidatus Bathyarchaeota archaeon]|nr:YfcE family phosphodiesterase [Candidatus Termiticorpusculum sp.]